MTAFHLDLGGLSAVAGRCVVGLGTTFRARIPPPRQLLLVLLLSLVCLLEYPPAFRRMRHDRRGDVRIAHPGQAKPARAAGHPVAPPKPTL